MLHSTALGASVAWTQYASAALWLLAATLPPSLLDVPDTVLEVLAPLLLAGMFGIGVVVLLSRRASSGQAFLLGGTAICGVLVAAAIALNLLIPTSLPGF